MRRAVSQGTPRLPFEGQARGRGGDAFRPLPPPGGGGSLSAAPGCHWLRFPVTCGSLISVSLVWLRADAQHKFTKQPRKVTRLALRGLHTSPSGGRHASPPLPHHLPSPPPLATSPRHPLLAISPRHLSNTTFPRHLPRPSPLAHLSLPPLHTTSPRHLPSPSPLVTFPSPSPIATLPSHLSLKPLQPDMGTISLANLPDEKKIGRGQFSEVYRARYLLDNPSVAPHRRSSDDRTALWPADRLMTTP
ncbi:unnamed protein product [Gadus morhua 'NCC']